MKTNFSKKFIANIPATVAILSFFLLGSLRQINDTNDEAAAKQCCFGYCVVVDKLQQFMIDSLKGNQFEGGIYSKADLINALSHIPCDSVYLMNVLLNCQVSKGTALAITSPCDTAFTIVHRIGKKNCYPCPRKACCDQKFGVARINRGCINYKVFNGAALEDQNSVSSAQ
jgi:hypothetical protein